MSFADRLARAPIRRGPRTSISGAIDTSMRLLKESNVEAVRQVIDISGDGSNNEGRPLIQAREDALRQGVTINGLPILLKRPTNSWEVEHLDEYYRDCVIGGPGAFMIAVRERSQFAEAIKTKIIREVAGLPEATIVPIQAAPEPRRTNCAANMSDWWRN